MPSSGIRQAKFDLLFRTPTCQGCRGATVSFSGIQPAKQDVLHATGHQSQQSWHYGVLLGHSASQAGHAPLHQSHVTALLAIRCPLWAFGEPSRTYFTPRVKSHSNPGVTVSFLGIRRAKQVVLNATAHESQQFRRYSVLLGHAASQAGHAPLHESKQSRRYAVVLGRSARQAGHTPLQKSQVRTVPTYGVRFGHSVSQARRTSRHDIKPILLKMASSAHTGGHPLQSAWSGKSETTWAIIGDCAGALPFQGGISTSPMVMTPKSTSHKRSSSPSLSQRGPRTTILFEGQCVKNLHGRVYCSWAIPRI